MPDATSPEAAELLEHLGYTIRISQTEFEWMAFITAPGKRPSITLGPDRDSVVAKACQWIEAQPRIEKRRR